MINIQYRGEIYKLVRGLEIYTFVGKGSVHSETLRAFCRTHCS